MSALASCRERSRQYKKILLATVSFLASSMVMDVGFAHAASDTSSSEANILSTASPALASVDELNFGEIVTTGGAGNVTISTGGVPTLDPGLSLIGGSPHQQAVMRITGTPAAQVDVNIVPGAYFVTNGVVTMPVTAFDLGAGASNPALVTIGGGGTFDLNIGATLGVGAGQQLGNYTGTFTVNADYH